MKHYCFIKAINVGGNSSVSMKELILAMTAKLDGDIRSFLNSGNIIINGNASKSTIEKTILEILKNELHIVTSVFVISENEIREILRELPFSKNESDKSKQLVYLMNKPINMEGMNVINHNKAIIESCYLVDDYLYVYYSKGVGKSKLTTNYIDKVFETKATGRNINTIEKIGSK